jgi:hypothetical protein
MLYREWEQKQREARTMLALMRMDIINFSMCHPKKPVQLGDLLPERARESARMTVSTRGPVKMTAWRRREVANGWRAFMGSGLAGYTTVETAVPEKL